MRTRLTLVGFFALALLVSTPTLAHAQFGKLKDALRDKAKATAGIATEEPPEKPEKYKPAEGTTPITPAALDMFLEIVAVADPAAEQAARDYTTWKSAQLARARAEMPAYEAKMKAYKEQNRAYDVARKEYDQKAEVYAKCQMKGAGGAMLGVVGRARSNPAQSKVMRAQMRLSNAERERLGATMEQAEERAKAAGSEAAAQRIMDAAWAEYAKAIGVTPEEMKAAMEAAEKSGDRMDDEMSAASDKCGPVPVAPTEPVMPVEPGTDLPDETQFINDRVEAALKKAGLLRASRKDHGLDAERLKRFLEMRSRKEDLTTAFTEAEIRVLEARRAHIEKVVGRERKYHF